MKANNKISNSVVISIVVISFMLILIVFSSFVYFINNEKNNKVLVDDGAILMTYNSENAFLSLSNVLPINDNDGLILNDPAYIFDFTVDVDLADSSQIDYEIVILKDSSSTVLDKDVRFYLEKQESGSYVKMVDVTSYKPILKKSEFSAPRGSMVLAKVTKKKNSTDNYRLRMWFSDTGSYSSDVLSNYKVNVNVYGQSN